MQEVPFDVEFQILDNPVITEKQQAWKRKFVSMELLRLIRKAIDKLRKKDEFWKDFKCFERSYGMTILSDGDGAVGEKIHLSLYPLSTSPCAPNSILFHPPKGRFRRCLAWERLLELAIEIQREIEYFLHKKIPVHFKYSIRSDAAEVAEVAKPTTTPVVRIFQEQEPEEEPQIPFAENKRIELEIEEWTANI